MIKVTYQRMQDDGTSYSPVTETFQADSLSVNSGLVIVYDDKSQKPALVVPFDLFLSAHRLDAQH